MANQSNLSVWCKDFPEDSMLERFGTLLGTVPFSPSRPVFTYFEARAVDATETPLLEQDLRGMPLDTPAILGLAQDQLNTDTSYAVGGYWDLWTYDGDTAKWSLEPQPLEIFCHGELYDNETWREDGHFRVNFGFEHFFAGHAGLLGIRRTRRAPAEGPEEARLLEAMAWPENLRKYQEKTSENIRKLLDWVRRIETSAVPVHQIRLWSEGEENFEARMEEILAAR